MLLRESERYIAATALQKKRIYYMPNLASRLSDLQINELDFDCMCLVFCWLIREGVSNLGDLRLDTQRNYCSGCESSASSEIDLTNRKIEPGLPHSRRNSKQKHRPLGYLGGKARSLRYKIVALSKKFF